MVPSFRGAHDATRKTAAGQRLAASRQEGIDVTLRTSDQGQEGERKALNPGARYHQYSRPRGPSPLVGMALSGEPINCFLRKGSGGKDRPLVRFQHS